MLGVWGADWDDQQGLVLQVESKKVMVLVTKGGSDLECWGVLVIIGHAQMLSNWKGVGVKMG